MTCVRCDNPKTLKAERKTILYKECGLDNVSLVNIPVYACPKCGETYRQISNPVGLHEAIATALLNNPSKLSGAEVRFLRKVLGYSGVQFARILRLAYDHLNKVEKGGLPVSDTIDLLVRFIVKEKLRCPDYQYLDKHLKEPEEVVEHLDRNIQFHHKRNGNWALAA